MRTHRSRAGARLTRYIVASICAGAGPLSAAAGDYETCKNAYVVPQDRIVSSSSESAASSEDPWFQACLADRQNAPKSVAVQSVVTMSVMTGFTGALMGRLDSARVEGVAGGSPGTTNVAALPNDGMMALGARQKPRPGPAAAPGGPSSPLVVYALGTYLGGSLDAAPMLAGYAYGAASGTVGVEYSASRYLILGLAAGFTAADADLTTNATMDADAIQAAAYLSYATREWFVDALAAYAAVDIGMARPVLGGLVRGNTDAGVFALAARGGYLFDFGKLRAGPIAGLAYLYGTVDGYTETGALATTVGEQTVESITGSAGLRFLAPFQAGGSLFVPYLNVTLEHQFGDGTQSLAVSFAGVSTPVSVPAFDARDFGKIEGGVTVELAPEASVSVNGSSTFARDDAKDFRIAAGVNYRF